MLENPEELLLLATIVRAQLVMWRNVPSYQYLPPILSYGKTLNFHSALHIALVLVQQCMHSHTINIT